MPKFFFLKHGYNNKLSDSNGQLIQFERISDSRGITIVENDDTLKADLDAYVKKRVGGVEAIDEKTYEDLKKNHPYVQRTNLPGQTPARLFDRNADPFAGGVKPAMGPASASPVVDAETAESAEAVAGSTGLNIGPKPVSRGRPVRTSKSVTPQPSEVPAAESPQVETSNPATPESTQ